MIIKGVAVSLYLVYTSFDKSETRFTECILNIISDLPQGCVASQQHYWPGFRCHTAAAKSCQSCPTLYDPIDGSPPGSCPWDSPGKNTGVGCHFLLQCMNVKSESEVVQSCPTLHDPMDCSPPGSSARGIFQAEFLTQYLLAGAQ